MKAASREKIALILFIAIILLVVVCFGAYLILGHKWNQAATTIDDATGDMKGYTTILYQGTSIPDFRDVDALDVQQRSAVPVKLVAQDYRNKQSSVIVLDSMDIQEYAEPRVVEYSNRRFGIVSFSANQTASSMRAKIRTLTKRGAECIIAAVPNKKLVEGIDGIDIVINLHTASPASSKAKSKRTEGKGMGSSDFFGGRDSYVFGNSDVGTVKAIIISPSKVVSTRVVDSR
ncbi:MAG: hypothetical protein ACOX1O_05125 [Eggerthellaceae bacterium]|jgi:hypothetical protein